MISWRILTYEFCAADETKVSEEENREVKEERDRPGSHDTDADKEKGHHRESTTCCRTISVTMGESKKSKD